MENQEFATMIERNGVASLSFEARFLVAGSVWLIASNAVEILTAARETFLSCDDATAPVALTINCFVDSEIRESPPWPQPHFRGLDHLVYAAYGPGSSMLIDLRRRRVTGLLSQAMARDSSYWKRVLLPILLGITSASIGISALHCACLVRNGRGLILGGASGAGKSTLAVQLALKQFAYLSDDWTYFSRSGSRLLAWGLPIPVKLLPDTINYFPELSNAELAPSLNGELAYEVDPAVLFGIDRSLCCEPQWLVFIERNREPRAAFRRISSKEAFSRFASELERLPACISDLRDLQLQTIAALVDRECWVLQHGLTPALVAQELSRFCQDRHDNTVLPTQSIDLTSQQTGRFSSPPILEKIDLE
jgi:hypothetical protein